MTWQELRIRYPEQWVLVEAIGASTEHGHRVIPELQVLGGFNEDWARAWAQYKQLHHTNHEREYYVLHTSIETLDIGVIDAFGHILS